MVEALCPSCNVEPLSGESYVSGEPTIAGCGFCGYAVEIAPPVEQKEMHVIKCPDCQKKYLSDTEPDTVQNPAGEYLLFCDDCRNFHYRAITGGK